MPALALQNLVQRGARTDWRGHCTQCSRVRFFLESTGAQEFLHIFFTGESALRLIMEFGFLAFFSRFHAANRNIRARDFVPPAIEPPREVVLVHGRRGAELYQFFFPTMRMTLLRFGHAQENVFALFIALALREIAISSCGLDFRLPVASGDFNRLPGSRRLTELAILLLGGHARIKAQAGAVSNPRFMRRTRDRRSSFFSQLALTRR